MHGRVPRRADLLRPAGRATPVSPRPRPASPATSSRCSSRTTRSSRRRARAPRWSHHWYARLLDGPWRGAGRERSPAARTSCRSTSSTSWAARTSARASTRRVTVHDACHGLRNLGVGDAPRALLERPRARDRRDGRARDVLRLRRHVLGRRTARSPARSPTTSSRTPPRPSAEWLVSAATSACLLHLEGRRRRTGVGPRARPPRRPARPAGLPRGGRTVSPRARHARRARSRSARRPRSPTRSCSTRCATSTSACSRRGDVADDVPELKDRAAAIRRETLAEPRPAGSTSSEATLDGARRAPCTVPRRPRTRVGSCSTSRAREGVTRVVKSKSMATEEIDLADTLEAARHRRRVETDLGEYIVQVAGERPSHMITPGDPQDARARSRRCCRREADEPLPVEHEAITAWARDHLRPRFVGGRPRHHRARTSSPPTPGRSCSSPTRATAISARSLPRVQVAVVPDREGHRPASPTSRRCSRC